MALIGSILGDIAGSQYEFSNLRPDNFDSETVLHHYLDDYLCDCVVNK